jgi:DNA-binding transcriptional regulator YiaG
MPNLASVLKEEIIRLAKKEIKAQTEVLRRSSAQHRRDIAALKKQVATLERKVALLEKKTWAEPVKADANTDAGKTRYSPKGLASHRKKLGLSAADYAKLVGVSSLTIYNWEKETSRPRNEQLAKLAAVRRMGKREALARLEQV